MFVCSSQVTDGCLPLLELYSILLEYSFTTSRSQALTCVLLGWYEFNEEDEDGMLDIRSLQPLCTVPEVSGGRSLYSNMLIDIHNNQNDNKSAEILLYALVVTRLPIPSDWLA